MALFECPSGLVIEMRDVAADHVKLLSDKDRKKNGVVADALLDACWIKTVDPGPYATLVNDRREPAIKADGRPDWQQVLQGDRYFMVTRLHDITYGPLQFTAMCRDPECKNHKRGFAVEIDLKDLPVKKLSAEDRASFEAGNLFRASAAGMDFAFRLRVGADETRFAKKGVTEQDAGKLFVPILCDRIVSIDGVDEADIRKEVGKAGLKTAQAILEAMDEHDCGVETRWENECPECGVYTEFEIPFRTSLLAAPKKARLSSVDEPKL